MLMALFPQVGRKQTRTRIAWWLMMTLLTVGVVTHLFPFYIMLVTSITPASEAMGTAPTLWTFHPTIAAWKLAFQWATNNGAGALLSGAANEPFWIYFWNSLVMTIGTLAISIPIVSLAARSEEHTSELQSLAY